MNDENAIKKTFGKEIYDSFKSKLEHNSKSQLDYLKANISGIMDLILKSGKNLLIKFPFYIKRILLNLIKINKKNTIHTFISYLFSEEGLLQLFSNPQFMNPTVKQNF